MAHLLHNLMVGFVCTTPEFDLKAILESEYLPVNKDCKMTIFVTKHNNDFVDCQLLVM